MSDINRSLYEEAVRLVNQGSETRNIELIDRGLFVLDMMENAGPPQMKIAITGLRAEFLHLRWQLSFVRDDLDRAILLFKEVGHAFAGFANTREMAAQNLFGASKALYRRFRRRRRIADIEDAIENVEKAIGLIQNHPIGELAEMLQFLEGLRQQRDTPSPIIVQADVRDVIDREELTSPHGMSNMQMWNVGKPRESGLRWVHSNQTHYGFQGDT